MPLVFAEAQSLMFVDLGDQLRRLLNGEPAAWRDPDPALRWSGWIRTTEPAGWLGPVQEALARRTVGN